MAKLQVFFSDLNYEAVAEVEAYSVYKQKTHNRKLKTYNTQEKALTRTQHHIHEGKFVNKRLSDKTDNSFSLQKSGTRIYAFLAKNILAWSWCKRYFGYESRSMRRTLVMSLDTQNRKSSEYIFRDTISINTSRLTLLHVGLRQCISI